MLDDLKIPTSGVDGDDDDEERCGRGEGRNEPERARTSQRKQPWASRARAASEPRQSSPPQQDSTLKIKFVMDLFA